MMEIERRIEVDMEDSQGKWKRLRIRDSNINY